MEPYTIDFFDIAQVATNGLDVDSAYVSASATFNYYLSTTNLFVQVDFDVESIDFPADNNVTITKCENNKVSGTFKGVLTNTSNSSETKTIEGTFSDICFNITAF